MNGSAARALACAVVFSLLPAVAADEGYRTPSAVMQKIVEASPTPDVRLSPDHRWMLLLERPSLIPIEVLAAPELRLGGLRIRPTTNGPSRSRPIIALTLRSMDELSERPIAGLPDDARIDHVSWSPDGAHVAFTLTGESRIEPWIIDVRSARARRLAALQLNAAAGWPIGWMPDGKSVVCRTVPADRGAVPATPTVPSGPVIQESSGRKAAARTYQDLLKTPHDEALFEHYLSAQLVRVGLDGKSRPLGRPGLQWGHFPSPDGRFLVVKTLHRPFSYQVPARRFPSTVEVLDAASGEVVHRLADLPLQDSVPIPFGSVPTGPRSFGWRQDAPATVYWSEAQDGGDAGAEAEVRDRLFTLAAPFDGEPAPLIDLAQRFGGVDWGSDDLALVYSWWWKTRSQRAWKIAPGRPQAEAELLIDHSWEDRYNDPGSPLTVTDSRGRNLLYTADGGRSILLLGEGASPEGDRPFLDKLDLTTRKTQRLFRSEAPFYEFPLLPLDDGESTFLVRRESREQPPNYFARTIATGELRQLTDFPHPTPELAGLRKEMIRYDRADGVKLTATLYLPPGYEREKDGPLPVLVWAYPQEFKSADAAGQVTDSPFRFDRVGWWSPLLFLTQGYAVLDDPTMPIIGEGDVEPNDTYIEQLVASAQAAVDEVVRRGIARPDRFAIGGHSYGAFMVANLLAHSDIFRAGIARSGAYNRTLTPFGFQAEERTVWQAPDIYFGMSPFLHADKVNEPILLIHGDADNNSGTFPMQSERFYAAVKGLGGTVRLVMLPDESHGYRARESILHMLWEQTTWLDRYVKLAPPRERVASVGASSAE